MKLGNVSVSESDFNVILLQFSGGYTYFYTFCILIRLLFNFIWRWLWFQLKYYDVEKIYSNLVFENYFKDPKCRSEVTFWKTWNYNNKKITQLCIHPIMFTQLYPILPTLWHKFENGFLKAYSYQKNKILYYHKANNNGCKEPPKPTIPDKPTIKLFPWQCSQPLLFARAVADGSGWRQKDPSPCDTHRIMTAVWTELRTLNWYIIAHSIPVVAPSCPNSIRDVRRADATSDTGSWPIPQEWNTH